MAKRDPFPTANIPITLTGEEWFALLARLNEFMVAAQQGRAPIGVTDQFSRKGQKSYRIAMDSVQSQLLGAQMALQGRKPKDDGA